MREKKSQSAKTGGFNRREFGQRAALVLTGAALAAAPAAGLSREFAVGPLTDPMNQDQNESGLSPQAQAEVESKFQHVLATYGSRLNDDQKKMTRRTIGEHVRMLEAVRPISVGNGDAPATVLALVERKTQMDEAVETSALSNRSRSAARLSKREA